MSDAPMNLEPLEDFAIDFGVTLAGWSVNASEDFVPLDANQVAIVMIAAVGTTAKNRPDYNPNTDIEDVVKTGVYAYGVAAEANFVTEAEHLHEIHEDEQIEATIRSEATREESDDADSPWDDTMESDGEDRADGQATHH